MKKIWVSVLALTLSGCAVFQPPPAPIVEVTVAAQSATPVAYALPDPPSPANPEFRLKTDEGILAYATAVNWYLYRVYNYTFILNKEAIYRGWTPPKIEPLCLTQPWPKLAKAPDIVIGPSARKKHSVEWSLTEYIKRSRALYEDQRSDFAEFEKWQRKMCNF